ncbi:A24 family peptidase [Lacipirellula parvula]|uniref:Type IV prepilin peptidase TadV/CpaA n=1 Tax=Lacipirellula parvula TaxID=2650471 RepID=A0A5K7XDP1_9BACT|nr:A24 family peptidase [Lacipirellula parvula]BBO32961.1 type IV prepilin peptidase TadV/CpaA [Lacipirellula parvula]
MSDYQELGSRLAENWACWVVTITLVVAAIIDGRELKVPNWITFPMIASGWIYGTFFSPYAGWEGLLYSLGGTAVGLAVLLPAYAVGGMGAGDVKLMAGVGAWLGATVALYAFAVSAIVGGVIAVGMVLSQGAWQKHRTQFFSILNEFTTIKDPEQLATIAAERKPRMFLLPYGIPMAIGSIAYFAWAGMLV